MGFDTYQVLAYEGNVLVHRAASAPRPAPASEMAILPGAALNATLAPGSRVPLGTAIDVAAWK